MIGHIIHKRDHCACQESSTLFVGESLQYTLPGGSREHARYARLPPHVAFADGGDWVGPRTAERYGSLLQKRLPAPRALFWFVASGLTVQTVYAVVLFVFLYAAGLPVLGWMGLSYSAAIFAFYLGFDPLMTWITGHQTGDVTAMFAVSPGRATIMVLAMVALYAILLIVF